jgi:hypothetical protein
MYPGYTPPEKPLAFQPIELMHNAAEDSFFYLKIVNQYDEDILVYLPAPPARKDERVTNSDWSGWDGPIKTLRGEI